MREKLDVLKYPIEGNKLSMKTFRSRAIRNIAKIRKACSGKVRAVNKESLHELRVSLKKLAGIAPLLNLAIGRKSTRELMKPYEKLFKRIGNLRTLQVEYDLIAPYYAELQSPATYLHVLHVQKLNAFEILKKTEDSSLLSRIRHSERRLCKAIQTLSRSHFESYAISEKQNLRRLINNGIATTDNLHRLRRIMKRFYLNMMSMEYQSDKAWEVLLDDLGTWHDIEQTIDKVAMDIHKNSISAYDISPLTVVLTSLAQKKLQKVSEIQTEFSRLTKENHRIKRVTENNVVPEMAFLISYFNLKLYKYEKEHGNDRSHRQVNHRSSGNWSLLRAYYLRFNSCDSIAVRGHIYLYKLRKCMSSLSAFWAKYNTKKYHQKMKL